MAHHTDHELLAEFVKNDSEAAFSALVARYVSLVYSTALRHTSNPHHAEEVTQAVFIILARKAVHAAPAALAATITTAVLTATSLTSATVAMTTLQKIAVTALLAATIGGGIYAAKQASDTHKEVRALQAQQAPMVEQIGQLQ